MKKNDKRTLNIIAVYVLIVIYIFLPRISVTNHSFPLDLFANIKNIFPTLAGSLVCIWSYQQYKYNKFKHLNIKAILLSLYLLYAFVNLAQLSLNQFMF